MGLFKEIIITARWFCTSFQSALLSISQPLGFRRVLYELDTKKKNPQTQEKLSARTSLRKIFAKPPPLLGPSYKSPLLCHPFKQEKARHSSWAVASRQGWAPVSRQTAEPPDPPGRVGQDGMGGMRNLKGRRAEPGTPACLWLRPGELSSCCWKTE